MQKQPSGARRPATARACAWTALALALLSTRVSAADAPVSLAGTWRFELDRTDAGAAERWHERRLAGRIRLPGALQNQGYGDDITTETKWTGDVGSDRWRAKSEYAPYRQPGNIKVPFFLQPEKHYVGAAWYQREIDIPRGWAGRRLVLTLERPHWETRVWLDQRVIGTNDSLSTPHVYDLGTEVAPGRHTLTLRIDNRMIVDVGSWSHSVSDHTQGNWNGVVGRISLEATSPVWIQDAQVYPKVARRSAVVRLTIGNATRQETAATIAIAGKELPLTLKATETKLEHEVALPSTAETWDEFTPVLQEIPIHLKCGKLEDRQTVKFGLREISTTPDRLISMNGRPTFLRGTLECCIFPKTGFPATDVREWKRIIRVCQAHGLNHIRFHSWCPPEAAFVAADELGFYYHVECAAWAHVGSGKPQDQWLYQEAERILRAYGNHPSFIMMAYGNEPSGPQHKEWLAEWVNHWKNRAPRQLHTSGAGWPVIPESQYHVTPAPRGPRGWLGNDYRAEVEAGRPRRDAPGRIEAPAVVHEMGQWCVYPNFDETRKYTGPLKPKNFDIFRDSLASHGMLDQWREFLHASGKLQALCYKEEIEAAFRTPGISGIQLLDLHDFPGQGTALVGVLDPFWEEKGYIKPHEFRRFFQPTVPLARLRKRVWTADETLTAEVEAVHFGAAPLTGAIPCWKLTDSRGRTVASGTWAPRTLPVGRGMELGQVSIDLGRLQTPAGYKLVVSLQGTPIENDWTVWVLPSGTPASTPPGIRIVTALDTENLAELEAGARMILATAKLSPAHPRLTFEPIFWNRYMFNTQNRYTLGLRCEPKHPALARFPADTWQDWLWNDIVTQARGVILDELPLSLRPIVQPIDDWNSNRRLGLIFECRVGRGRLLVCAADLDNNLDRRPAARQLRESLVAYAASPRFAPTVEASAADLARVLHWASKSTLANLGAKVVKVDSEDRANGHVAANAIDGDPDTIWHTRWQPANDPMPHELVIDLGREVMVATITYLPRQDMANGRVAQAEIYCSAEAGHWAAPAAKVRWDNSGGLQQVQLPAPIRTRHLRFVAHSEVNGNPFAAIAELDVKLADK